MDQLPPEVEILETIRENHRFATHKGRYKNKLVFIKQPRHPKLDKALRKELWGIETFTELSRSRQLPFAVPKIIACSDNYLITSWAKGKPMGLDPTAPNYMQNIDFLAQCYAAIDKSCALANPIPAGCSVPQKGNTIATSLEARLLKVSYRRFFDQKLLDKAVERLKSNVPKLLARLTHADLTPNNILVSRNFKTLIDYESASLLYFPRFYDVVNYTLNRMINNPGLGTDMGSLASKTFEHIGENPGDHVDQINTIALIRAISIIVEYMGKPDELGAGEEEMTPEMAAHLSKRLHQILSGKLYFE